MSPERTMAPGDRALLDWWCEERRNELAACQTDSKTGRTNWTGTRGAILLAHAEMEDFTLQLPANEPTSTLGPLLYRATPDEDHPIWKGKKSRSLIHQIGRMVSSGLLHRVTDNSGNLRGSRMSDAALVYLHDNGYYPEEDLLDYAITGQRPKVNTNEWYLTAMGKAPPADADNQFTTPGRYKWRSIGRIFQRHRSPKKNEKRPKIEALSTALAAIDAKDTRECWAWLDEADRMRIVDEVVHICNPAIKRSMAQALTATATKGTLAEQVERLNIWYAEAHENEDAETVIAELIVRAAWMKVRGTLDHRMNDSSFDPTRRRDVTVRPRTVTGRALVNLSFEDNFQKMAEDMRAVAAQFEASLRAPDLDASTKALSQFIKSIQSGDYRQPRGEEAS